MILSCCHIHQTAILGLYNQANDNDNLLNHILLISKDYIYMSREKRALNIDILKANLIKVGRSKSKNGEANKHCHHQ